MIRTIKDRKRDFAAILFLVVIAAGVAGYILDNQRLRFPLIEDKPFKLKLEFETAQAVTPGQGQTVRVAGVRVGDISKVDLAKNGNGIITVDLDRQYDDLVHTDATAFLRPKTGLKDMFIELNPGTKAEPMAKENWTVPVQNTLPDVNPDEFLSALDVDTRDYVKLLLNGAGRGLDGRGGDLREVLRRFEPTYRDLAAVSTQVAKRRRELARLIHSLNLVNAQLKSKDDDLAQLIKSSSQVFRAFASERDNVSATVAELPSALKETGDALAKVEQMALILRPAADNLRPAVRALNRANPQIARFARDVTPDIRNSIRPFVREARPFVRELRPAAIGLSKAEPGLTRSFKVLNHLFNMLGFNPNGREGPDVAGRNEGYLFYLSWLSHQSVNLFGNSDAHGPFRPLVLGGTCGTLRGTVQSNPAIEFALNLTGALTDPNVCGGTDVGSAAIPTFDENGLYVPQEEAENRGQPEGQQRSPDGGGTEAGGPQTSAGGNG